MLIEEIRNIKSSKEELRKFGLSVGLVLLAIGGVFWWYQKAAHPYLLAVGGALVLLGVVLPALLLPVHKVWMTFAVSMGWFMSRVILTVLFFAAFAVIGSLARLAGKQFIETKWDKHQTSYWNFRERRQFDPRDCERQF